MNRLLLWVRRVVLVAASAGLLLALTHWAPWTTVRWLIGPWLIWMLAEMVIASAEGPSPAQVRLERRAAKQVAYERAVERARHRS